MDIAELRRKVLDAKDLSSKKVHVAEWDVDLWVRTLTGAERDKIETEWLKRRKLNGRADNDTTDFRAFVACWTVVDGSGKQVFDTHSDVNALTKKSGAALQTIWNVAADLNRFTDKDVEELAGNLETAPSGGSTSDSPSPLA